MSAIQVEFPPGAEPVSLDAAKSHCRVTTDADSDVLAIYLQAARESVEVFLTRSLVNKGFRQSLDSFPYFTNTEQSQLAYPPSYYSLPRYSTTLWNYSQMIKLLWSPLVKVSRISYVSSADSAWHDLLPKPVPWSPGQYVIGHQVADPAGNLQEVTATTGAGNSGDTEPPVWSADAEEPTQDGDVKWTYQGPAPAGDFLYDRDHEPPRIFPLAGQNWPSVLYVPNAVQIHYVAGYGADGTNVPGIGRLGVLHTLASYYENRESVSPDKLNYVPGNVEDLLWGLRVLDFAPTRG